MNCTVCHKVDTGERNLEVGGAQWRLHLRAAARSYSALKYDIPKGQIDRQGALMDARATSLLNGMLYSLRIDLMWSLKHLFCLPTLLWPNFS